ncbi:hypothetical protein BCR35DRAFT_297856 [Leucosporidium creatinivorum]|uniref:Zn(2)-C6 fungal-type domain-containing protein n=1 Tax=Leucosporidium creatinivorum TaxID=106004 RepID=A0A1Y2G3C5_9BASI|nr:hypothetical protein BCR35DRAFT_297856 [Leucosporidium creatinivorum]
MSSGGSPSDEKPSAAPQGNQAKRGARACVSCRKGKNRCVNAGTDAPCERCSKNGTICVFEQPANNKTFDEERIGRMEDGISNLSSQVQQLVQMLGTQATQQHNSPTFPLMGNTSAAPPTVPLRLDASFNARSPSNPMTWEIDTSSTIGPLLTQQHVYQPPLPPTIPQQLDTFVVPSGPSNGFQNSAATKRPRPAGNDNLGRRDLPQLPNYRAPPHPVSMYGIIPSTAPSSDDEDSLPTGSLTAPLEALAQAASEAHIQLDPASGNPSGTGTPVNRGRARKRRRPMPPPPNAFPDVVTRELVSDATCRQIFAFFIENCLPFFPILDRSYDTYESLRERTPWSINSIVMVAASRMPDPSNEIRQAAEHGSEEAQGIARSSLFGPTVRPEGCQAMGLVAAWQTSNSPYMASGHSLRMSMELGLHRALGKLAEDAQEGRVRSQTEQRSLIVSARIFLCLYWLDWVLSTSSGRPHFVHEELIAPERLACFLKHPLAIDSDKVLVAQFELMACRSRIEAMSGAFETKLDSRAVDFTRRSSRDLTAWYNKWDAILAEKFAADSFERKRLECYFNTSLIFLYTSVLKGANIGDTEHLSVDARELAMLARSSASAVLDLCDTPAFRDSLRYATHEVFVDLSFACLLVLKLTRLFSEGVDLPSLISKAAQLQSSLGEFPGAQRFSMTIKIALDRFAKSFNLEVPSHKADILTGAFSDTSLLNPFANPFPFLGNNHAQFDMQALPDSNWVGSELFPEWIKTDTGEQDWSFESAFDYGIDRLFLPQWSTGIQDQTMEW